MNTNKYMSFGNDLFGYLKTRVASQTADLLGTVGKRLSFTTYLVL